MRRMKKIGILTYHTGYNYGASLQAYALQTSIQRMQPDCEIINFETEDFLSSREMFSRRPRRPKEIIKVLTRLPYYGALKKRQSLFDRFTAECLQTSPLYRSEEEVVKHACEYACIVCGSDQIWNLSESDEYAANPIFFLNFPKKQKRVSYAASFGKWVREAPKHEDIFLPWLKQFDLVSVREASGLDYLKSRGIDSRLVLDPTLLLDSEDYDRICAQPQMKGRYVLMFSWNCDRDVMKVAKTAAGHLGLPLIHLVPPPRAMFSGIKRKLDAGPREFLSLIKNAEFVVTNSFHGTAFSTIYGKPYVSVVTGRPDPRMESLLQQIGLSDHLAPPSEISFDRIYRTDYGAVREKIGRLRMSSLEYLKRAVSL